MIKNEKLLEYGRDNTCKELQGELDRMKIVIDQLIEPELRRKRIGKLEKPELLPLKKVNKFNNIDLNFF